MATTGADGWPYVVPMLYVYRDRRVYVHGSSAKGHLRTNVEHDPRACFVVDEPGAVYAYGRFQCDSSLSYQSVIAFGKVRLVGERAETSAFFDAFMAKYSPGEDGRPRGFYPRLDSIVVYAMSVERLSGKAILLPTAARRWPAIDRTLSPGATAPRVAEEGGGAQPLPRRG
jgi:nitroimidazol reductase NimA-like FMN-containing flavoprotein (pyridoxamine 5'-phosphate oxidase superfamily)